MTAAGWYPDPQTPGRARWWDGDQWTAEVREQEPPSSSVHGESSSRPFSGDGGYQGYTPWDGGKSAGGLGELSNTMGAGGYTQSSMGSADEWQPFSPSSGAIPVGKERAGAAYLGKTKRVPLGTLLARLRRIPRSAVLVVIILAVGAGWYLHSTSTKADPNIQKATAQYLITAAKGSMRPIIDLRCSADEGKSAFAYNAKTDPLHLKKDIALGRSVAVSQTSYAVTQQASDAHVVVSVGKTTRTLHVVKDGKAWKICS